MYTERNSKRDLLKSGQRASLNTFWKKNCGSAKEFLLKFLAFFVVEFSKRFCKTHFSKICVGHASFLDARCCVCVYHYYYNLVHLLVLIVHRARIPIACNSTFIVTQPSSGSFQIIEEKMRLIQDLLSYKEIL